MGFSCRLFAQGCHSEKGALSSARYYCKGGCNLAGHILLRHSLCGKTWLQVHMDAGNPPNPILLPIPGSELRSRLDYSQAQVSEIPSTVATW